MIKNFGGPGWIIIATLFLASCASGYHAIQPATLYYPSKSGDNGITVEYQTNLLKGKYASREIKSGVTLIAVKIVNNTDRQIIPKNNLKVFSGKDELSFMSADRFYDATQQNPDKSLLFLFLLPMNVYTFSQTTDGGQVTSQKNRFYPVGLVIGPALAFGNRAAAKSANRKFKKDLDENDVLERIIRPGETVYGLLGINSSYIGDLTFKTIP